MPTEQEVLGEGFTMGPGDYGPLTNAEIQNLTDSSKSISTRTAEMLEAAQTQGPGSKKIFRLLVERSENSCPSLADALTWAPWRLRCGGDRHQQ
jgi:hypothetical protein